MSLHCGEANRTCLQRGQKPTFGPEIAFTFPREIWPETWACKHRSTTHTRPAAQSGRLHVSKQSYTRLHSSNTADKHWISELSECGVGAVLAPLDFGVPSPKLGLAWENHYRPENPKFWGWQVPNHASACCCCCKLSGFECNDAVHDG